MLELIAIMSMNNQLITKGCIRWIENIPYGFDTTYWDHG